MWIHLEVEPCRDEAGEISDFLAVAHDITERREAEQVLPRQSDPAPTETDGSAASRSEAAMLSLGLETVRIGRLLGPITREIEALTQARRDDADEARLCELGRRASRLAAQLSEVGEQGAATPCEVDVSNLARACASELAEAVPPCAQLDYAFAALPPLVHVDAARLSSLLLDMLQASLVALDGDWGTVSLSTGVTEPGRALRSEVYHRSYLPTLRDTQPRVFIELHDTAGSLDPAELRRLSEGLHPVPAPGRIFTLLRARALLAELGGELDVSSAPGCGTRVLMLLPVAEA
jgi:signal transduction histidine kinase